LKFSPIKTNNNDEVMIESNFKDWLIMHTQFKSIIKIVTLLASLSFTLSAEAVAVGTYVLNNHPDGSANPPPYGLRLDGLLTGNTNEIYTFDFDHAASNMLMTYDGSTIVISGTAFGGEDAGNGGYVANTTAVWNLNFSYTMGVAQLGGDGGLDDVVVTADYSNYGTLTSIFGDFELSDKAKTLNGPSFTLGDESGSGHRGFNGISGWGWLRHGSDCIGATDCSNIPYSDWLFTATVVPVPAASWLFGSALLGLAGFKRRK
jgi:hypothetical protein